MCINAVNDRMAVDLILFCQGNWVENHQFEVALDDGKAKLKQASAKLTFSSHAAITTAIDAWSSIMVIYGHLPEIQQQGVIQISTELRRMVTIYDRRPDLVLSAFHATLKICFDPTNDRGFSDGIPYSVTVAALTLFSSDHMVHETRVYHQLSTSLLVLLPLSLRKELSVLGGSTTFITSLRVGSHSHSDVHSSSRSKVASSLSSKPKGSSEVCDNHNFRKQGCTYGNCNRRHVCKSCSAGDHVAIHCPVKVMVSAKDPSSRRGGRKQD
jgi:hypothetical protein